MSGKKSDEENQYGRSLCKRACPEREIEFIAGSPIPNDQPVGEDGKKKGRCHLQRKKGHFNVLLEKIDY